MWYSIIAVRSYTYKEEESVYTCIVNKWIWQITNVTFHFSSHLSNCTSRLHILKVMALSTTVWECHYRNVLYTICIQYWCRCALIIWGFIDCTYSSYITVNMAESDMEHCAWIIKSFGWYGNLEGFVGVPRGHIELSCLGVGGWKIKVVVACLLSINLLQPSKKQAKIEGSFFLQG